jgi:single-strand DNA-binding protein
MASINKVILIGNVGNDPEVKYFDGGNVVARFSVATNEKYTNRTGEQVEQTEWFRVETWNEQAKTVEKYLKKGQQIYVEGRLRTETFTDRDGKERFSLGVRATTFQFLGGPNSRDGQDGGNEGQMQAAPASRPQQAPAPRPQATSQPQQTASATKPAPASRQPEPVPAQYENSSADDDLPF